MSQVLAINPDAGLVLRNPSRADGAALWRLIGETGTLEQNTPYTYLLLCSHFHSTCLVAEQHGRLEGCVLAYLPPRETDCVFVWQIGVAPHARGRGLAGQLLDGLLYLPACRDVHFVTATVAPGNTASRALFASFARRHGVTFSEQPFLDAGCFPGQHPDEPLLKIGPLLV